MDMYKQEFEEVWNDCELSLMDSCDNYSNLNPFTIWINVPDQLADKLQDPW